MHTIIFLLIIAAAVGVCAAIVMRKLPQLTHLDVENLPREKEVRKKREMLSKRMAEETVRLGKKWQERWRPLQKLWGELQLQFRIYVGKIERLWRHEQRSTAKSAGRVRSAPTEEEEQKFAATLQQAEQHLAAGNFEPAEELFIAAIKLQTTAVEAYQGLGNTYVARGAFAEAKETYKFVLRLDPKNDAAIIKLAEIAEQEGNVMEAINWYQQALVINDALSPRFYHLAELLLAVDQPETAKEAALQAVELEPKNPKYLDLLIQSAILGGDKDVAVRGYEELRLVNPDNQKLKEFKEEISKI